MIRFIYKINDLKRIIKAIKSFMEDIKYRAQMYKGWFNVKIQN